MPVWSFLVVRSVFVYLPKVNMSMPERVCMREFRFGVVWGETAWTFSKDAAGTDCSNLHLLLDCRHMQASLKMLQVLSALPLLVLQLRCTCNNLCELQRAMCVKTCAYICIHTYQYVYVHV